MTTQPVSIRKAIPVAHDYVRELWARREFAVYLALGNLKARNASTTLGLVWWVLNPLLLGGIYALIFGEILQLRVSEEAYVPYLLAGMFPFYYTRSAMVGGVNSIVTNTRMIANLRFPRLILPLSTLFESAVGFWASLGVFYFIAGPIDGVWPGGGIAWLVPAFVIHTMFNLGLSAIVARVAVPFRDINNLVPYLLRLWLYLSPIIYPLSFLKGAPESIRRILELNPLFPLLSIYRHALIGHPLDIADVIVAAAWGVALMVVGVAMFVRYEGRMTKYL